MALTPETLVRHELIGLHAAVAAAPNPDLVGVEGRVVRETRNTLTLRSRATVRQVPKRATTFEFRLPADPSRTDEPAADREAAGTAFDPRGGSRLPRSGGSGLPRSGGSGLPRSGGSHLPGDDVAYVTVDGATLLSRPARRTENAPTPGGDDRWR